MQFTKMFEHEGTACGVHGSELQEEMVRKHPRRLMEWLFETVGEFHSEGGDE